MRILKRLLTLLIFVTTFSFTSCQSSDQGNSNGNDVSSLVTSSSTKTESGTPLSEFIPLLKNLEEDEIESVYYQIRRRVDNDYYLENYQNNGQKDIHRVYVFLQNCRVKEYKGFFSAGDSEEITYTILFKNQTKLECVAIDRQTDYFYSETAMYPLRQLPKNVRSYVLLSLTLPRFENSNN